MGDRLQILFAMVGYMLIVILIGVFFAKRAQANSENYFLGGRSLGPWVAAMSAEASDMSGWLLMGLPGVAYWCGLADAAWTAIGLAVGTYINWLLVSKRLRSYSIVSGDAITVPDFLSNRYHEKKKVILGISALFILIFFTVYAASCFVTCGKLFSGLFGYSYHSMMIAGAIFVLIYTAIGGFLAESASDFMQAVVMIIALVGVLVFGTAHAGGINAVIENGNSRLFIACKFSNARYRRKRRAAGGRLSSAFRRSVALRLFNNTFNRLLGAWLFRYAAGAAALYGYTQGLRA